MFWENTINFYSASGITMLIKASVKNSLLVDAKATAIALATKKNANQFAYFSKNPK